MSKKLKAVIIGPGNIGTDLLMKIKRSDWIDLVWMVGIDPESSGLKRAAEMGIKVSSTGLDGMLDKVIEDDIRIAFDATSTPAAIGPFCIPPVNLKQHAEKLEMNVNMVTCGGQATIPMVAAVSRVQDVEYGEIIATVSSRSVGPGTRQNIDEFTRTTSGAVEKVGGAKKGKAIIIINPAEPPLMMRDTIHCLTKDSPDQEKIIESVHNMVNEVKKYVPGYKLVNGPVFDGNKVSVFMEVKGLGDFLPEYAGNLDIMTAAALRTAEMFAEEAYDQTITLPARG